MNPADWAKRWKKAGQTEAPRAFRLDLLEQFYSELHSELSRTKAMPTSFEKKSELEGIHQLLSNIPMWSAQLELPEDWNEILAAPPIKAQALATPREIKLNAPIEILRQLERVDRRASLEIVRSLSHLPQVRYWGARAVIPPASIRDAEAAFRSAIEGRGLLLYILTESIQSSGWTGTFTVAWIKDLEPPQQISWKSQNCPIAWMPIG